jgi:hypothetical protein
MEMRRKDEIMEIVRAAMREHGSLHKNGETRSQYITRTFPVYMSIGTFAGTIILAIFTLGGRAVQMESNATEALAKANAAAAATATVNAELTKEIAALRTIIGKQAETLDGRRAQLATLEDRQRMAVTRQEFNNAVERLTLAFRTMTDRLANIERRLPTP